GEITLPSENLKSLLKTANALQISDLTRLDVLGMTAIDSEDITSCKTEGVHSQRANSINEHKEDIPSQLSLPVIARKDKLHDNRAECAFLLSSRKRPREEAFSETELLMPAETQSKTPRLADDNYSATPDETSVLAEVKVEDFEEYEEHEGLEDYTADDYKHCDKSLLQSEQFPGSHSDTAYSISIKEEPID
ncbi:uncharacterized protein LOC134789003, partial [Penaeus indicus]|uniref:uncharacterized protein LOC134789003 n=1 Tax=Penaeus indicus TaxID=29960 RepID=UPI00300C8924